MLSLLIFFSIVLVISLTFVALILGLGCLHFLIMLFEHFISEIEFVVDRIFSLKIGIKAAFDLIDYGFDVFISGLHALHGLLLFCLVLLALALVREHFIPDLHLFEDLVGRRVLAEIRVVLFDELEV